MRILVLNYEYPPLGGGAAPVCRDLSEGMATQGHEVTVVTMGFQGLPDHETHNGVEIHRVKCLRKKQHSCKPAEAYSYILATKKFLKEYLKNHTFDVCHTHFILPTGVIATWVKREYGLPYIITAHGSDVEGYNQKSYMKVMHRCLRPIWRRIARAAYAVVAPSEYLMRLMNQEMVSEKYVCIPNGLDLTKYQADPSKKEKRILLMGRMQKAKNFQTVFKAISEIPEESWGEWIVDVLGDGPYKKELEELCLELGIENRVSFHGWVDNGSKEQMEYIKYAAIYISASHFENCPMAVLETMAAECYPLLSDIEGHRQFFDDGEDEYFFQMDNSNALSRKLGEAVQRELCSLYGKLPGISTFGIMRVANEYTKLLEKAVSGRNAELYTK